MMPEFADGHPSLQSLRERVVSLAGMRFEKFFHRSTSTHIVRQLEGTEFRPAGIKGYGDFADEAYAHYRSALGAFVLDQNERQLREIETHLVGFAPVGKLKVELQVQLPDSLTEQIKKNAKEKNVSLGAYVTTLLDQWLPYDFDEAQVAAWTANFVGRDRAQDRAKLLRQHTLTVPVAFPEFERLERITDRLAATENVTLGDVVYRILDSHNGTSPAISTYSH